MSFQNTSRQKSFLTCDSSYITTIPSEKSLNEKVTKFVRKNNQNTLEGSQSSKNIKLSNYSATNSNKSVLEVPKTVYGNPEIHMIGLNKVKSQKNFTLTHHSLNQSYLVEEKTPNDVEASIKYLPMSDVLNYNGKPIQNIRLIERRLLNKVKLGMAYY